MGFSPLDFVDFLMPHRIGSLLSPLLAFGFRIVSGLGQLSGGTLGPRSPTEFRLEGP